MNCSIWREPTTYFCHDAKVAKNLGRRFGSRVSVSKDYNRQNNSSRQYATGIFLVVKHILPPVGSCVLIQHLRRERRDGRSKQLRPEAAHNTFASRMATGDGHRSGFTVSCWQNDN